MDITLNWLDLPYNERPQIYTVYVPQIDQEGHRGGPYSAKMNSHIKQVDNALGYLIEQIELRHLDSHVHIVIVSDHGMAETDSSRLIYYDDILSKDVLQHVMHREAFPLLDLRPDKQAPSDTIQKMYHQLYAYTQTNHSAHYQVFLKQDIPERYHYKHSDRITPVVAIPDVGYTFVTHQDKFVKGGNHGYDNLADEMRAIFLAKGPKVNRAYREGTVLAPFFNTEVYEFITELLNMDAAPNNGTLRADFPILTTPPLL
ncbi:hypothetical protein CU098_007883 [Rhizopus stolonifer]|uniref:Uncharacterized protein n=2 Tax=Mucorineae TaxID=1344963 RepID=A0A367IXB5_RHIST|nr:hypothetical protein CU098_007883 [Rhizopus stolonifer]